MRQPSQKRGAQEMHRTSGECGRPAQHEEEELFKGILDKIEIIGTDGKGLFFIDHEIGKLAAGERDIVKSGV